MVPKTLTIVLGSRFQRMAMMTVMAEKKTGKKKKKAAQRERSERRFEPGQTQTNKLAFIGGMVGALGLGAGVYG